MARLRVGGDTLAIGVNHHLNPNRANPAKVWDRYAGCLVMEGTGTYENWRGEVEPVGPGAFVHHFPGKYHHILRDDAWHETCVLFDTRTYDRFFSLGLIDDARGVVEVGTGRELVKRFERINDSLSVATSGREGAVLLEMAAIMWRVRELSASIARGEGDETLIEDARARLAVDVSARIDLEDLADELDMSYSFFRRRFREVVGQSPGAYRNEQRLDQARLLLEYNRVRIADVADRLGYADQFVFSRQFKKRFGVPPKAYNQRFVSIQG